MATNNPLIFSAAKAADDKPKDKAPRLWPTGQRWREGAPARQDDGREVIELDPDDVQMPGFPGLPGPGLDFPLQPAPAGPRPDYTQYPKGPYRVEDPTPWDLHRYPATPEPPSLPPVSLVERTALQWLYEWWLEQRDKREEKERRKLPPADFPPLLPASIMGGPVMPSGVPVVEAMSTAEKQREVAFFSPSALDLLDDYLKRAGIRHIGALELTPHKWRHIKHVRRLTVPPRGMRVAAWSHTFDLLPPDCPVWLILPRYVVPDPREWPTILPVLRVVDRFREWYGAPVTGISGYRHPWYNAQIDGATDSRHMRFAALDFTYGARNGLGRLDTDIFKRWFEHLYRGPADGLGVYDSFIHLDINTRPKGSGKALNWDKRTK